MGSPLDHPPLARSNLHPPVVARRRRARTGAAPPDAAAPVCRGRRTQPCPDPRAEIRTLPPTPWAENGACPRPRGRRTGPCPQPRGRRTAPAPTPWAEKRACLRPRGRRTVIVGGVMSPPTAMCLRPRGYGCHGYLRPRHLSGAARGVRAGCARRARGWRRPRREEGGIRRMGPHDRPSNPREAPISALIAQIRKSVKE
jgi:hypothetical protein